MKYVLVGITDDGGSSTFGDFTSLKETERIADMMTQAFLRTAYTNVAEMRILRISPLPVNLVEIIPVARMRAERYSGEAQK